MRTIAAVGGSIGLGTLLFVGNQISLGANADAIEGQFAARFNSVWHQPARGMAALAMLPPDPVGDSMSKQSAVPTGSVDMGTDIDDAVLSPVPTASRAPVADRVGGPRPVVATDRPNSTKRSPNGPTAATPSRPRFAGPVTAPVDGYASTFSLPDVSDILLPTATLGVAALGAYELQRSRGIEVVQPGVVAYASPTTWTPLPAPAPTPMALPGPFHVFVTTQPGAPAASSGGGNSGGNGNGTSNGNGNGNGNGVVSSVADVGNGAVSGVGNGVGNAGGNDLGHVTGLANGVGNGVGNAFGHKK
jgi:hypothetical protein